MDNMQLDFVWVEIMWHMTIYSLYVTYLYLVTLDLDVSAKCQKTKGQIIKIFLDMSWNNRS